MLRRLGKKLLLLAIATLVAVLAGEVAVRILDPIPFSPFLRDFDPVYGVRYKKNLEAEITYPEFVMQFSTNSRGFRGPEPPDSSDGCVLFLGDSFTEGWGVNDGEEFPALIREALAERYGPGTVGVINASMSNSGNCRWINVLRDIPDYRPRLVVFQLCFNDVWDNMVDGQFRIERGGVLFEELNRIEPWHRKLQPWLEAVPGLQHSRLFALSRHLLKIDRRTPATRLELGTNEPDPRPNFGSQDRLMVELLRKALTMCKERGWPTALVSVMIGDPRLAALKELCEEFDTPIFDVRNRIERPELYYAVDMHWNKQGHRWVADHLLEHWLDADSRYLTDLAPK